MTNREIVARLTAMRVRADRVRHMIHWRAVQEYHRAFGREAQPGDHLDMCVIHNSMIGNPWREVDYSHMRRAAWLVEESFKPSRIVSNFYARVTARNRGAK